MVPTIKTAKTCTYVKKSLIVINTAIIFIICVIVCRVIVVVIFIIILKSDTRRQRIWEEAKEEESHESFHAASKPIYTHMHFVALSPASDNNKGVVAITESCTDVSFFEIMIRPIVGVIVDDDEDDVEFFIRAV